MTVSPASLTHQHIFGVLNTILQRTSFATGASVPERLKILDIGCGDGALIGYLQTMLEARYPDTKIEIYGFDIDDFGYASPDQRPATVALLEAQHPQVDWSDRVHLHRASEDWRFTESTFDFAVSNQVLEHVDDLDHFLRNVHRVLKPNGQSVHLFPLGNCIMETHTHMPFVHHVLDHESRVAFAGLMNRLGLSRYFRDRTMLGYDDMDTHARDSAEYLQGFTCYRSFREFHRNCNRLGLTLSSCYTKDLYLAKLRQVLNMPASYNYQQWNYLLAESMVSGILKYVSSVTLTMSKIDYDIGERIRKEKAWKQARRMQVAEQSEATRRAA